jgi:hypothetical protein
VIFANAVQSFAKSGIFSNREITVAFKHRSQSDVISLFAPVPSLLDLRKPSAAQANQRFREFNRASRTGRKARSKRP